jgi:hypothetical protein
VEEFLRLEALEALVEESDVTICELGVARTLANRLLSQTAAMKGAPGEDDDERRLAVRLSLAGRRHALDQAFVTELNNRALIWRQAEAALRQAGLWRDPFPRTRSPKRFL